MQTVFSTALAEIERTLSEFEAAPIRPVAPISTQIAEGLLDDEESKLIAESVR